MNKSKLARTLGVSRPTLYKMLKEGSNEEIKNIYDQKYILTALSNLPAVSPIEIEEFLEWLDDNKCLSGEGKRLRKLIWEQFVKEL